ncbi:aryl-sulfate sulfotransferase [bacterium]|nr:aryl-sulfate sulfotransferase [bacterium]
MLLEKVEKLIEQNRWEEAVSLFNYLKDIAAETPNYRKSEILNLEKEIDKIINKNLNLLYEEGKKQLNRGEFKKAMESFSKILQFNLEFKDAPELFQMAKEINDELHPSSTLKAKIVVTSKTPDKIKIGLRIYKPEKCYNGYTLFVHQPPPPGTAIFDPIFLIDMKGNIVYKWYVFGYPYPYLVQLEPNGHIFYTPSFDLNVLQFTPDIKGVGLYELNSESETIWYLPALIDHDFHTIDKNTYLIEKVEVINKEDGFYLCPYIEIVNRKGKVLWQWRGDEHVGELKQLLNLNIKLEGDWAHINYCEMIGENLSAEKDKRFQKGNILFSYGALDLIGIIDYHTKKIVWAWGPRVLQGAHAPTMLKNGHILIFDNGIYRGWSRIVEMDPLTGEIVWEYHAEPKESFYSEIMSNAVQLPNGNILICEGTANRIFEITRDGEIVWDFISPFNKITGGEGIYRAYRYSPEYVRVLLGGKTHTDKK